MSITVRCAACEELPRVNALREQVNRLHCEGRPDIFRPGFCRELQAQVYEAHGHGGVLVAVVDEAVAGYAMTEIVERPESPYNLARRYYHVVEFGVDVAYRRRGVATALVEYMKRDARAQGLDRIDLDVWEFNESARSFYEAAGFRAYRRFLELPLNDEGDPT